MLKIKINSFLSIITAKTAKFLSKLLSKGGSNFPGAVALKFDKHILKTVAKDYTVILVTGTNGKTTTTNMIYNIIKGDNNHVITNSTGANMVAGITSCFIDNYKFFKNNKGKYAVIEVDEAYVPIVTEDVKPKIITVTNLFRDQLDRYGEIHTTFSKIFNGVEKTPNTTLVLNGDESLFGKLDVKNTVVYYGFEIPINKDTTISMNSDNKFCKCCKSPYKYEFVTYNHLGYYYCENCGYKRPELKYKVEEVLDLSPKGSTVIVNTNQLTINQAGEYNIYNGLCAYSIGKELGISDKVIFSSLENQSTSFGRQETINIDGKEVKIILVKNPAGYDQAVNTIMLDKKKINLALLLNDKYADGRDVSWIWDVNFEKLNELAINNILISGTRLYDMAVRLKIAGFDTNKFTLCDDGDTLIEHIKSSDTETTYILATYTAMLNIRKTLHSKGYIDKIW
ncbi:Mur ligase family protein [Clostridium senegalense]|uniref:Mur ligase family protein n=1 Tax=Clostridium senegalense TaxID=1465809 RepID=UPI001C1130A0|nr:Mur ligase family protein [Clostridium senegalense]